MGHTIPTGLGTTDELGLCCRRVVAPVRTVLQPNDDNPVWVMELVYGRVGESERD